MSGRGSTLRVRWLGRVPYQEAWDLQRAFHEGRAGGRTSDDYLLLLEHPHVYTVGRNGDGSNLLVSEEELARLRAELHFVDRGGDITYHGPGQLVGYPVVHLGERPDLVAYVRRLERALIAALGRVGVEAYTDPPYTGVWSEGGKVAAIGVRVTQGVTMHGFALNVSTDLSYFSHIVPCGIEGRPVTSVAELAGEDVRIEDLVGPFVVAFAEAFGYDDPEVQLAAFTRGQRSRRSRPEDYQVDRLLSQGTFSESPLPPPVGGGRVGAGGPAPEEPSPGRANGVPITLRGRLPGEPERPPWMKVKAHMGEGYRELKQMMRGLELHTVCEEAGCPNIYECWDQRTATLMILGDKCTRACAFCNVTTGKPTEFDVLEPFRAAEAVARMGLEHAVITSVNRDDLADGGSSIFAETIRQIRLRVPDCDVEVLIPDFKGDPDALQTVMDEKPEVLNHNTETVLRLQREIRTSANYGRSLALLARAKWMSPAGITKSGLIVGMGETREEVMGALADLRTVGVDIVTIGQYLRPTPRHRPIDRFVTPEEFAEYRRAGEGLGFAHVEAGPFVRSSYHARDAVEAATGG